MDCLRFLELFKYAPGMYDPVKPSLDANDQLLVEMVTDEDKIHINYSFDNSFPDSFIPVTQQRLRFQRIRLF